MGKHDSGKSSDDKGPDHGQGGRHGKGNPPDTGRQK